MMSQVPSNIITAPEILEAAERFPGRSSDIKAFPSAAEVAFLPPPDIAFKLVDGIESVFLEQALCKT